MILDYDAEGALVSLEILNASRRVTQTRRFECSVLGYDPPDPVDG